MDKLLQPIAISSRLDSSDESSDSWVRSRRRIYSSRHEGNESSPQRGNRTLGRSVGSDEEPLDGLSSQANERFPRLRDLKKLFSQVPSRTQKLWKYRDENGHVKGPMTALKLLKCIETGFIKGRGDKVLFTSVGDSEPPRRLADILPEILKDANLSMEKQTAPPVADAGGNQEIEVAAESPMQFADDAFSTEAVLDIQKLHKSFGSCDLVVWLVPPQERLQHLAEGATESQFTPPPKVFKIPVHSALLRISSPIWLKDLTVVEAKHRTKMKCNRDDDGRVLMKYVIESFHPAAIRAIIQYIYGYRHEVLQGDPFLQVAVYKEASRLEMKQLQKEVLRALSAPMNIGPLVSLAKAAEVMKVDQLLLEAIRILAGCAYALFSGMRHLELGPKGLQLLLLQDNIQLDEPQIYICANAWLAQQGVSHASASYRAASFADDPLSPSLAPHRRKERDFRQAEELAGTGSNSLTEPPPGVQRDMAMAVYRSIRFDSMSPSQIQVCRDPLLDSLLLEACLRKFSHLETKPRVFPWQGNDQFTVERDGGLYPVLLKRTSRSAPRFREAGTEPLIWAWTLGDSRLINEALWGIEVVRTAKGRLHFGIAVEDKTTQSRQVCYLDPAEKAFVTGTITNEPTAVSYRTVQPGGDVRWYRRLCDGDIVIVRVSVTTSAIHLSIQVLKSRSMRASYMLALRSPVCFPGQLLQRPFLAIWPFIEAVNIGDTLGVAELQVEAIDIP
ncbi:hypothetical protein TGVAND_311880 [Toxoplasma gondii VAND]|uniref:GYF domain protein n=3 Tax=Toxoplasma gondii TaxID=5811 RepID=A0A086QZC4_TOXGO|nr:hypothetical protein TGVAND_311880 [Toxoplasma gondii VAND]KFH17956.1 hypothetical protein TGMAS_311880 [Toxoplasma gondii MAS]